MAFRTNAAPYQRAKRSTLQIMIELGIALLLVWIAGVIYTFKAAEKFGVKSILMMLVALAVTAVCDVITTLLKHKKDSKESLGKEIVHDLVHNYSWITAIIFTLTLPVWTSYYVVIIGSVFATVVVKNFFGGFGKNIFNPAIMARIFVGLCFATPLSAKGIFTHSSVDAATGATITTAFNNATKWLSDLPLDGLTMKDLFLGNYFGSLGETFTLLILVLGVILAVRKVINWRTPVFYLGTVALTALVMALVLGFENPFRYVGYHIALGGLAFGAIFMITDPVTGPTSSFGKSLIGVIAGLLTMLIRVKGGYPEGVMYSIAIVNLLSPAIDYFTVGKTSYKLPVKYAAVFGTLLVSIGLVSGLSWSVNGGKEVYEINGIPFGQYETLTTTNGIDLKEGHQLAAKDDNSQAAYYVVDENGTKVAVVYKIDLDEPLKYFDGYQYGTFNFSAYVVIDLVSDTIYDIGFAQGGSDLDYQGTIEGWADKNINGKDSTGAAAIVIPEPVTGHGEKKPIGATFSAGALKEAIAKAYEIYASENA